MAQKEDNDPEVEMGLGIAKVRGPKSWVNRVLMVVVGALLLLLAYVLGRVSYGAPLNSNLLSVGTPYPTYTLYPTFTSYPTCTPFPSCTSVVVMVEGTPNSAEESGFPEIEQSDTVMFEEEFINNDRGWRMGEGASDGVTYDAQILDGQLQISVNSSSRYDLWWPVPGVKVKDFCLSFDADFTSLALSSPGTAAVAIKWRETSEGYYFARFYTNGTYSIYLVQFDNVSGYKYSYLRKAVYSPFIHTGEGKNIFKVCTYEQWLQIYSNGNLIAGIEDGNMENAGQVSIGVSLTAKGNAELSIDNFVITGVEKR